MAAKKFIPSQHPRDRFGRFTRSHSAQATAAERKAAGEVAASLKPKRGIGGNKASGYLSGIGPEDSQKAVSDYTAGGYVNTHKALRAGKTDSPDVRAMDDAMVELPDDLVLSRRVPSAAFGKIDPESLVGLKVADAAYAPASIGTVRPTKDTVRMRIAAPSGTRAAVSPDTGEVILDRDLEMVVAKVEKTTTGVDMYVTVLPKQRDGKEAAGATAKQTAPAKKAAPAPEPDPEEDGPAEGADEVRAALMRKKLPELRADAKARGLKGYSKLRKSELVDRLVADETGDERRKPSADTGGSTSGRGGDFDRRASAAAAGHDALAAPNSGITFEDSGLPAEQAAALKTYRDGRGKRRANAYEDINESLRSGEPGPDGTADTIAQIDAALEGSALGRDIVTWRGLRNGSRLVGADRWNSDLTGMEWREDAYISTTADRDSAASFFGSRSDEPDAPEHLMMRILTPAGTRAVRVSDANDEAEVLLDRGHTVRVVADRGVDADGIRQLDVEVVPAGGRGNPRSGSDVVELGADEAAATSALPFEDRAKAAAKSKKALDAAPVGLRRKPDQLDAAQREALNGYRGMRYGQINSQLRDGDLDAKATGEVARIDEVMEASRLTSDVQVYRGVFATRDLFGERAMGDLTGIEWREDAYVSTSASKKISEGFADRKIGLLMRIVVPAGTGAVQVSSTYEAELLLERGRRYRVVADNGRTPEGRRLIDVEVLPDEAPEPGAGPAEQAASNSTPATPAATTEIRSARTVGADLRDAIKQDATRVFEIDRYDPRGFSGPMDLQLQEITRLQGFGAPPRNVTSAELDAAVSQGWTEVWRGAHNSAAVDSGTQMEQLRRGEFEPGKGIYGNGLYASERRATADQFAGFGVGGRVIRMALDPQARVVEWPDLQKEHRAWLRAQYNRGKLSWQERGFYQANPDIDVIKLLEDPGRFAAARGYDAIRIDRKDDGASYRPGEKRAPQYAVLNRSVLMIQEGDFV